MITKENFKCENCGECCLTYTVKLSNSDIKRIERLGYKKEEFAEIDSFDPKTGNYALKRRDDGCTFLIRKNNKWLCSIYSNRPKICTDYPFNEENGVDSCKPKKR